MPFFFIFAAAGAALCVAVDASDRAHQESAARRREARAFAQHRQALAQALQNKEAQILKLEAALKRQCTQGAALLRALERLREDARHLRSNLKQWAS